MKVLYETNYRFSRQTGFRRGKVRDIYEIDHQYLVIITTDRISAYDVVLKEAIPYKGQVLTQVSDFMFQTFREEIPLAWVSTPDPNVLIMRQARVFPVEVIVRRCLVGYVWRLYRTGGRLISGVRLPEGLIENDILPEPIITPHHQVRDWTRCGNQRAGNRGKWVGARRPVGKNPLVCAYALSEGGSDSGEGRHALV
ncbi:MAG: hypothetical protein KatS3mg026_1499 [Bacteroidia bacterium]|nr:MAG: hypothetical protein KatS3mg026_1499 [Bacteroidia bacterium]